ncbi:MAG: DUF4290 domain-containing protein [Prevotella sp.]|nr:DUF4290 domain-containing protein [Prevotella sp.]
MNIEGLDYNTQREKLIIPEYGREIQNMVDHAMTLPTKEERLRCAKSIITIMERMFPQNHENDNHEQTLWNHLALMSNFQLDIDWPYDPDEAKHLATKPEPLPYPMQRIPLRHYGNMIFELFDKLKTMEPGKERDELVRLTANQMRRNLSQWSHSTSNDEIVASDLARYTDGVIQIDLSTFKFDKTQAKDLDKKKKKK